MYLGNIPQDQYLSVKSQQITGNGGSSYTLDYAVSTSEEIAVFVNNVRQNVSTYSVSSTTLTLGGTISASDSCWILFLGRTVGTKTPAVGSVTNDMLAGSINESKLLGSIPNSKLANSSITLNGSAVSLGGSASVANTPAFRAYRGSSQSISNVTATVIGIDTEDFDTDGCFNHTTSTTTLNGISVPAHSFAPNISGKYLVNAALRIDDSADWDTNELAIYKNGSTEAARVQWRQENYETGHISTIVDFNGTSDYIYLRFYHARGGSIAINGGTNLTFLEAYKLIGA